MILELYLEKKSFDFPVKAFKLKAKTKMDLKNSYRTGANVSLYSQFLQKFLRRN